MLAREVLKAREAKAEDSASEAAWSRLGSTGLRPLGWVNGSGSDVVVVGMGWRELCGGFRGGWR